MDRAEASSQFILEANSAGRLVETQAGARAWVRVVKVSFVFPVNALKSGPFGFPPSLPGRGSFVDD